MLATSSPLSANENRSKLAAIRPRSADFDVADAVRAIAAERGLPPAQVALAWLLGRPGVTAPLIGATRLRHLDDALAALEVRLTGEETARLEAPYLPRLVTNYA